MFYPVHLQSLIQVFIKVTKKKHHLKSFFISLYYINEVVNSDSISHVNERMIVNRISGTDFKCNKKYDKNEIETIKFSQNHEYPNFHKSPKSLSPKLEHHDVDKIEGTIYI